MTADAWITLGVVLGVLVGLVFTRRSPDIILLAGLTVLLLAGVIDTKQAIAGMANEGVITIGVLYIVAAGLRDTGGMSWIAQRLLGRPGSLTGAQARIMLPIAGMSAFMNNTPLVAMLLPVVGDWSKAYRFSVSKLLIPLSYASIFGGACTLIGTSTNLIIDGWLIQQAADLAPPRRQALGLAGFDGLGMFAMTPIGLPVALVGIGGTILLSRWLLPERRSQVGTLGDPREYTVEMVVEPDSPLVGKTIEDAGLRNLPGLYLVEIDRDGEVLGAVGPTTHLHADDRLVFAGVVDSVVDLQKTRGLKPATDQVFKLDAPRTSRVMVEAVVSHTCPAVGRTIRDARFRSVYNAAVIAVGRNGERLPGKIGDIVLKPGDTLLLEAAPSFVEQQRNSRDFYLVSRLAGARPPRHERAPLALAILAAMVAAVAVGWMPMLHAALVGAGLMLVTRCCSGAAARAAVDWSVLIVIAAALGIGAAMQASGLAAFIADELFAVAGDSPLLCLAAIYALTMVLASLVTSKAAAVLVLPIALGTAIDLGVALMPFAMAVLIAAATTIATPIGYPTNLMVYGPGGYRFTDYVRIGVPLSLAIGALTIWLVPTLFPF